MAKAKRSKHGQRAMLRCPAARFGDATADRLRDLQALGAIAPTGGNSRQAILTNYLLRHADATDRQAQRFLATNHPGLNSELKHVRWARNRLREAIDEARRKYPDASAWRAAIEGNRTVLKPAGCTHAPSKHEAQALVRPPSNADPSPQPAPALASAGFAREAEAEARRLAERLGDSIHGVKCWHGAARQFDQGSARVFVGINPGGGSESQAQDEREGYYEAPYRDDRFNAWLDETWQGWPIGRHKGQRAAQRTFEAMYGEAWEDTLRSTACFDVVPFRTPNIRELPEAAWALAKPWFRRVLEQVRPRLVICNGNSEGRSPWAVLHELYGVERGETWPIPPNVYLKQGRILDGPLRNARVIALPSITRFAGSALDAALEKLRPFA